MLLVLLCTAQFVVVLDVTIVAVSLPAIQADLGFTGGSLQWVVTAYSVAFGGLLIPAGRAGDVYGRRRLFRLGLALFAAASAGCGLARSPAALIALRAVQGAGAAVLAPAALALVTAAFPDGPRRRRALAAWTAAAAVGGATGWVAGGTLTQALGWQAVFLVNVPLGIAGVLAAPRLLPADGARRRAPLDVPGAAAVTVALGALVLGLTQVQDHGLPAALPALAASGLALVALVLVERRAEAPLMPPEAWREGAFLPATLVALALTAATSPAMLLSVLYQQHELGRSATAIGLACAPMSLAVVAGSLVAGRLSSGHRATMLAGLAAVAGGALLLSVALVPGYVVMGAGLGAASVASTAAATSALGSGAASGVLTSAAQVGTALGLALLLGPGVDAGYAPGYAGAAAIALLGMGAQLSRRSKQREVATPAYAPKQGIAR
jgi:MFS family permease